MASKTLSNNIRIFPSSGRSVQSSHYTDNFVTEYNLSSVVNKLLLQGYASNDAPATVTYGGGSVPVNGFLISTDPGDEDVEFNINGYFISVPKADIKNAVGNAAAVSAAYYQDFVWFDKDSAGHVCAFITFAEAEDSDVGLKHVDGSDMQVEAGANIQVSKTPSYALPIYTNTDCTALVSTSKLRFNNINIDDGNL